MAAYNLRRRPLAEELLEDDERQGALDVASSGEEDAVEDENEEFEPPTDSSLEEAEEDVENASLAQRLLDIRARQSERRSVMAVQQGRGRGRGRPTSTLRGANGYRWSTNIPERQSGKKSQTDAISFSTALIACLLLLLSRSNLTAIIPA